MSRPDSVGSGARWILIEESGRGLWPGDPLLCLRAPPCVLCPPNMKVGGPSRRVHQPVLGAGEPHSQEIWSWWGPPSSLSFFLVLSCDAAPGWPCSRSCLPQGSSSTPRLNLAQEAQGRPKVAQPSQGPGSACVSALHIWSSFWHSRSFMAPEEEFRAPQARDCGRGLRREISWGEGAGLGLQIQNSSHGTLQMRKWRHLPSAEPGSPGEGLGAWFQAGVASF